ncbi:MAG: hypothetical protein IK018_09670, partial [Lachnospiraceae bacterium]|nr:hypothetical protein [Lachnospiraceae bacterium]
FVYKRCISFTKMASGVQNWRFVYKYAVFNLQTSISPYKLAPRITTQPIVLVLFSRMDYHCVKAYQYRAMERYDIELVRNTNNVVLGGEQ